MANPKAWIVRVPIEIADKIETNSVVAISWFEAGNLSNLDTKGKIKSAYRSAYPGNSESKINAGAGQLYRFSHEIQVGDFVITPLKASREVLFSEVVGEYEFDPEIISKEYPNIRRVKWILKVPRDKLFPPFINAVRGQLTVFQVRAFSTRPELLILLPTWVPLILGKRALKINEWHKPYQL